MSFHRARPRWFAPLVATALGTVLAWVQVAAALGVGVLDFTRRFDAGSDNDWLLNFRNLLWLCMTAVVLAALATRLINDDRTWRPVVAAALGAATVLPLAMTQAARAQHLNLVGDASGSAAQAVITGIVLGAALSVVASRLASARASTPGVAVGTAVVVALLVVGASTSPTDPPVLGALDLPLDYGARNDLALVSALLLGPVTAALACLFGRWESTRALLVAGLAGVGGVAAVIVATLFTGPAPSGDHSDLGLVVLAPLLVGAAVAYGLLAVVARHRRSRTADVSVSTTGSAS
ncbi:hypothetical protein [Catellatospora methionotrophica]|uniref:hypothetical protein n=1 Tax=Catellatospora methionotrophica TaxID=121620 RepID=UPI003410016A